MDPAIFNLLDARDLSCRLRVGVPNLDEFRRFSPAYARRGEYEIADTQAPGAFRKFLEECDVIVLNYEASAYAYRPSGLMADAAGCGVPVVIPNLPVQRVQVRTPVPIGEVRAAGEPLSTAVIRAAAAGRARRYDFAAYARARSQDALTRILDARVAEAGIP